MQGCLTVTKAKVRIFYYSVSKIEHFICWNDNLGLLNQKHFAQVENKFSSSTIFAYLCTRKEFDPLPGLFFFLFFLK